MRSEELKDLQSIYGRTRQISEEVKYILSTIAENYTNFFKTELQELPYLLERYGGSQNLAKECLKNISKPEFQRIRKFFGHILSPNLSSLGLNNNFISNNKQVYFLPVLGIEGNKLARAEYIYNQEKDLHQINVYISNLILDTFPSTSSSNLESAFSDLIQYFARFFGSSQERATSEFIDSMFSSVLHEYVHFLEEGEKINDYNIDGKFDYNKYRQNPHEYVAHLHQVSFYVINKFIQLYNTRSSQFPIFGRKKPKELILHICRQVLGAEESFSYRETRDSHEKEVTYIDFFLEEMPNNLKQFFGSQISSIIEETVKQIVSDYIERYIEDDIEYAAFKEPTKFSNTVSVPEPSQEKEQVRFGIEDIDISKEDVKDIIFNVGKFNIQNFSKEIDKISQNSILPYSKSSLPNDEKLFSEFAKTMQTRKEYQNRMNSILEDLDSQELRQSDRGSKTISKRVENIGKEIELQMLIEELDNILVYLDDDEKKTQNTTFITKLLREMYPKLEKIVKYPVNFFESRLRKSLATRLVPIFRYIAQTHEAYFILGRRGLLIFLAYTNKLIAEDSSLILSFSTESDLANSYAINFYNGDVYMFYTKIIQPILSDKDYWYGISLFINEIKNEGEEILDMIGQDMMKVLFDYDNRKYFSFLDHVPRYFKKYLRGNDSWVPPEYRDDNIRSSAIASELEDDEDLVRSEPAQPRDYSHLGSNKAQNFREEFIKWKPTIEKFVHANSEQKAGEEFLPFLEWYRDLEDTQKMRVYNYASGLIDTPEKTVTGAVKKAPYEEPQRTLGLSRGSSKKRGVNMGTDPIRKFSLEESKIKFTIKNSNKDKDLEELNRIQKTIENILTIK